MKPIPGTSLDTAISRINRLLPGMIERASLAEAMFLIGVDCFLWAHGLGKPVEAATAIAVEGIRRQIRDFVPRLFAIAMDSPSEGEQTYLAWHDLGSSVPLKAYKNRASP
jgi:hypothetical protein